MIKFILNFNDSPRPMTAIEWSHGDMADIVLYMTAPGAASFAVLRRISTDKDEACNMERYGFVNATKLFYLTHPEPLGDGVSSSFNGRTAAEAIEKAVKSGRDVLGFPCVHDALTYVLSRLTK